MIDPIQPSIPIPNLESTASARLDSVLRFASARDISDVHIKAGHRPLYRRFGRLISRREEPAFDAEDVSDLARSLVPAELADDLARRGHVTFMIGLVCAGRYRVTVLRSRSLPVLSIRMIPTRVLSLRELNLPKVLTGWAALPQGLLLVSGAPGMGKSSTWLAILEHMNTASASARQIVTLESPVEQPLDDKVAFIHQRELGSDVQDVAAALEAAQRQGADVLALDGLGATEVSSSVFAANLQQLVLATVPAAGAVDAIRRLLEGAPVEKRAFLRLQLARRLRGVVHQALVPAADGKGMVPACEALVMTQAAQDLLKSDKDVELLQATLESQAGRPSGMICLDQALCELIHSGSVTLDAATKVARDPEQLRARAAPARPSITAGVAGMRPAAFGASTFVTGAEASGLAGTPPSEFGTVDKKS